MVDIHTHILPGLDDGSKDIEESLELLRDAKRQGINTVFATPHFITGLYQPPVKSIISRMKELRKRINEEDIDIELKKGTEIGLVSEMSSDMIGYYSMDGKRKYILIELPFVSYPLNCDKRIYDLISKGFKIILAHPERAFFIMRAPGKLKDWKKRGILIQVNTKSILGRYGKHVKKLCIRMLKQGIVDFVATDTHNKKWGFDFEKVIPVLKKLVGKQKTRELLGETAHRLLLAGQ
jgi:protein-tyrosine phosphatase